MFDYCFQLFEQFLNENYKPEESDPDFKVLLIVATVKDGIKVALYMQGPAEKLRDAKDKLQEFCQSGKGNLSILKMLSINGVTKDPDGTRKLVIEEEIMFETLKGVKMRFGQQVPFASSAKCIEKLVDTINSLCPKATDTALIDVGSQFYWIGYALAKSFGEVHMFGVKETEDTTYVAKTNEITNCNLYNTQALDHLKMVTEQTTKEKVALLLYSPTGVFDPNLIQLIRGLSKVQTIVWVTSDMQVSSKKLSDIYCAPSTKVEGSPFVPVKMVPVDMFPHKHRTEIVVLLERKDLLKSVQPKVVASSSSRSRNVSSKRDSKSPNKSRTRRKERSASRSPGRTRTKRKDRSASRSPGRTRTIRKDRSKSRSLDRYRSKRKDRSNSRSPNRSSKKRRNDSRSPSRLKKRDYGRSRSTSRSRTRRKERSVSRSPVRSRNKKRSYSRSPDRNRGKRRERSNSRERNRDRKGQERGESRLYPDSTSGRGFISRDSVLQSKILPDQRKDDGSQKMYARMNVDERALMQAAYGTDQLQHARSSTQSHYVPQIHQTVPPAPPPPFISSDELPNVGHMNKAPAYHSIQQPYMGQTGSQHVRQQAVVAQAAPTLYSRNEDMIRQQQLAMLTELNLLGGTNSNPRGDSGPAATFPQQNVAYNVPASRQPDVDLYQREAMRARASDFAPSPTDSSSELQRKYKILKDIGFSDEKIAALLAQNSSQQTSHQSRDQGYSRRDQDYESERYQRY